MANKITKRTPGKNEMRPERKSSKFLIFPDGSCCRPYLIAGINKTETGVAITSSNGTMIGFISVGQENLKSRVLDLLRDSSDDGKKFVQPDWSFLDSNEMEESTEAGEI